jgi:hypothetical protein
MIRLVARRVTNDGGRVKQEGERGGVQWAPMYAHRARGSGVYSVDKIIRIGFGANKFCVVYGARAQ